jgi:SAM-dependent methyltransferase
VNADEPFWRQPSEQAYYLLARWQASGRDRLLDLGCGIGRHALLFAAHGFSVDAYDLSEQGIAILGREVAERGLPVRVRHGDMLHLPYEDATFDCLLGFHAIYHTDLRGLGQVLSEVHRVLAEGGEAYLTFNSKSNLPSLDETFRRVDGNTLIPQEGEEAGIPHCLVDEGELRALLAGFRIVRWAHIEDVWEGGRSWHYFVLLEKGANG